MKRKNLSKKEKEWAFGLLMFFVVALVVGVKSVYAYYYSDATLNSGQMIASYVGDFYTVQGDISIDFYQSYITIDNTKIYKKVDAVPTGKNNPTTVTCTNPNNSNNSVTCNNDNTGDCYYIYTNSATASFKLTSKTPVNCKVYFD